MSPLSFGLGSSRAFGIGLSRRRLVQTIRTFNYTGSEQSYTIPANFIPNDGIQSIQVYVWGAGGGGNSAYTGQGGCGGFAQGLLQLSANTSCKIIVGEGGIQGSVAGVAAYGGGGTSAVGGDCGGGGLSGIFETSYTHSNSIIIAGGGGGMGGNGSGGLTYYGGCGGGLNGEGSIPQSCGNGGGGGTQSAGGSGGVAGSQLQGGGGGSRGGSGGGGYYGGGFVEGFSGCGHPGGGGGSGYLHPSKITSGNFSSLTYTRAAGSVPQSSNPYYISGIGNGSTTSKGGNGLIVVVENVFQ